MGGVVDAREWRNERKNVEADAARVLRLEGGVEARLLERHVPVSASQSAKNELSALSLSVSEFVVRPFGGVVSVVVLSAVVAAALAASHLGALGAPAPELVRDERHFVIDVVPSVDEFHARTACGGRAVDARSGDFEGYSHALQTDSPGQLKTGGRPCRDWPSAWSPRSTRGNLYTAKIIEDLLREGGPAACRRRWCAG